MVSSLAPFASATLGAVVMALAFPKANVALFAPVGAVGLFWAWFGVSPRRAFWVGWLAGTVFFTIDFWWFGETAGALIAPFGFLLALGPAIGDAFFAFALVGALVAFAAAALAGRDRTARALVPLGAAALFALGEWLRSQGLGTLGVPFGSLGFTQVASPLAPLAAWVGTYGITFAVCVLGAYGAYAIRLGRARGVARDVALAAAAVGVATALAWAFWPAHAVPPPHLRVAALQGNIAQSLKFTPAAFGQAVARYEALTLRAARDRPALIVWPETVVPTALNRYPVLQARFAALAERAHAELAIGTNYVDASGVYNVVYFFRPDGGLDAIYRKRQLVPFAEHLPFAVLGDLPWARNIAHFREGRLPGIVAVGDARFAPVVCWESAFTDLVGDDVRAGASALIVATDDAWFGTTAGPYQHAQIAQMRALETGRWIVRAAATGISGLVAPDGRYTQASRLGEPAVVSGRIGAPVATAYDRIGGNGIAVVLALVALGCVGRGRLRRG